MCASGRATRSVADYNNRGKMLSKRHRTQMAIMMMTVMMIGLNDKLLIAHGPFLACIVTQYSSGIIVIVVINIAFDVVAIVIVVVVVVVLVAIFDFVVVVSIFAICVVAN